MLRRGMGDHVVNGVIASAARRGSIESDPPRECLGFRDLVTPVTAAGRS
jgi:hypothetical protein